LTTISSGAPDSQRPAVTFGRLIFGGCAPTPASVMS
jgi:hypothetical protein